MKRMAFFQSRCRFTGAMSYNCRCLHIQVLDPTDDSGNEKTTKKSDLSRWRSTRQEERARYLPTQADAKGAAPTEETVSARQRYENDQLSAYVWLTSTIDRSIFPREEEERSVDWGAVSNVSAKWPHLRPSSKLTVAGEVDPCQCLERNTCAMTAVGEVPSCTSPVAPASLLNDPRDC